MTLPCWYPVIFDVGGVVSTSSARCPSACSMSTCDRQAGRFTKAREAVAV